MASNKETEVVSVDGVPCDSQTETKRLALLQDGDKPGIASSVILQKDLTVLTVLLRVPAW